MLDFAWSEMLLCAAVALIVIGPKELPQTMRTVGRWVGKARGVARHFRSGFDAMVREAELEEMEKRWREENERIMREHPAPSGAAGGLPEPAGFEAGQPSGVPAPDAPGEPAAATHDGDRAVRHGADGEDGRGPAGVQAVTPAGGEGDGPASTGDPRRSGEAGGSGRAEASADERGASSALVPSSGADAGSPPASGGGGGAPPAGPLPRRHAGAETGGATRASDADADADGGGLAGARA